MIKRLVIAAAAFSFIASPALAGERASLWNDEARPVVKAEVVTSSQSLDRASATDAWYPGCLAVSVIDGINDVNSCIDAWSPTCLASSIGGMVGSLQSCGN